MRQQAMQSKMLYGRPIPVGRILQGIADRESSSQMIAMKTESLSSADFPGAQANTQNYGRRPYGVGFLVIGQDVSVEASLENLNSSSRKLVLTCTSSPQRVRPLSTMHILSVTEVRVPRHTSRRTLNHSKMVRLAVPSSGMH